MSPLTLQLQHEIIADDPKEKDRQVCFIFFYFILFLILI